MSRGVGDAGRRGGDDVADGDVAVQGSRRRDGVVVQRCSGDGEPVALPSAAAPLSDRVRVLRWGIVAAGEPRIVSRESPPPLYRLRDGGPPASSWAGPPIRARGQGTSWPLGQLVEINFNTCMVHSVG